MDDRQSKSEPGDPSASRSRRLLRVVVIFVVVPYVMITLLFTIGQRRLLYHPLRSPDVTLAPHGLEDAGSDVTLSTDDGLTLHGWLMDGEPLAESNAAGIEPSTDERLLVIYFPGNASHRGGRVNDLRDFTRLGCDVLIFDYRGYAENAGSPSETAIAADARAIWKFAVEELQRDPQRIVLFGESLGGAVAIDLAARLSQEQTPPAGVITNATFDSVPELATAHYPLFPFRWLVWDRWPSLDRIGRITCPVLMFHGTEDSLVPIEHGRRLFAAAPERSASGIDKTFVPIEGAGHNDIPVSRLREDVGEFLRIRFED